MKTLNLASLLALTAVLGVAVTAQPAAACATVCINGVTPTSKYVPQPPPSPAQWHPGKGHMNPEVGYTTTEWRPTH